MQGMDLEIFGGLSKFVEGVMLRAPEDSLSLSFLRFSSSSNCRGSDPILLSF